MAKAKGRKLKVFRTAIGFHDAYVAAPSMKAALEAWGSTTNLFAAGLAEPVTDAKLMKAPLASPGQVFKLLRGDRQAQMKAAGPAKPKAGQKAAGARPAKKPSRARLDAADKKLAELAEKQAAELDAIRQAQAALEEKRRAAVRRHEAAMRGWRE